jgi:hypothetical protein
MINGFRVSRFEKINFLEPQDLEASKNQGFRSSRLQGLKKSSFQSSEV